MELNYRLIGAAVCALILAPGALAAPPPTDADDRRQLPAEGVITNPYWDAKPNGDDLEHLYPPLAQILRVEGRSAIHCAVETTGALSGCRVISEAPAGLGFGYATLLAAADFHMKPSRVDGRPVKGYVTVPLAWKLAGWPAPPAAPSDAGPRPSQSSLVLATRIVAARGVRTRAAEMMDKQVKAQLDAAESSGAPFPSPDQEAAALSLLHDSFVKAATAFADEQAVQLARTLSLVDLERSALFLESSAGRALIVADAEIAKDSTKMAGPYYQAYQSAHVAFCQKAGC